MSDTIQKKPKLKRPKPVPYKKKWDLEKHSKKVSDEIKDLRDNVIDVIGGLETINFTAFRGITKLKKIKDVRVIELTEEEIEQIPFLAGCLTQAQIAQKFGVHVETMHQLIERDPRISAYYNMGLAETIGQVSSVVLKQALSGNLGAATFYLKAKGGWREQQDININSETGCFVPPHKVLVEFVDKKPSINDLKDVSIIESDNN